MRSSAELVRLAQAGDQSAFAELVGRYERVVTASAWAVLRDFHAAQDVAQECFVIAHGQLRSLRAADAFGPWLLRTVRREALRRAARSRTMISINADAHEAAAPAGGGWEEEFESVVEALSRLPEQERVVVVLRYLDVLSVNEIAQATDRPVGTVTKQLSRALERLRHWLTSEVRS